MWWRNIGSLFSPSLLYSFVSVLLIPSGLAAVGLADITGKIVREHPTFGLRDSLDTIKRCWKQALCVGMMNVLLTAIMVFACWFYLSAAGFVGAIGVGLCLLAMMIFSFMKYYIWPQIIMFKLPLWQNLKNAFLLAFINFKRNLIIGLTSLACYAFAVIAVVSTRFSIVLAAMLLLATCIFPGFKQMLVQYCVLPCIKEHVIDPYYAEHPEEDIEERQSLGL